MEQIGHSIGNLYRNFSSALKPMPTESTYLETGTLTPMEFQEAGDFLTHRCGTWSWARSDPSLAQPHLKPDKQFLVTKGVPCRKRASTIASDFCYLMEPQNDTIPTEDGLQNDWLVAEIKPKSEYELIDDEAEEGTKFVSDNIFPSNQNNIIEEIKTEFIDENSVNILGQDGYIKLNEPEDTIEKVRRYDLSITYDTYYQTPRFWLEGFNELGLPLTYSEIFEDISSDYAKQTATVEAHPCLGNHQISIHPCQHASMMKFLVDTCQTSESKQEPNKSLILFLKFLSSIVPTIDYDYTLDSNLRKR
jgi:ubiquitin-like-conjugating enzyme ATG3